ncbi:hypothetical protein [Amycolatopsis kentuckyensis]|uniref:hypothetical protein n=1 Tax=Amycolatopsis kentuckyensis TaxID=218823 RepID=UPI003564C691
MTNPTDELRAAARLLRGRAAAVPPGKWVPSRTGVLGDPVIVNDRERPTVLIETHAAQYEAVNDYLLLLSPDVAEPLACLLEEAALRRDRGEEFQAHAENLAGLLLESAAVRH